MPMRDTIYAYHHILGRNGGAGGAASSDCSSLPSRGGRARAAVLRHDGDDESNMEEESEHDDVRIPYGRDDNEDELPPSESNGGEAVKKSKPVAKAKKGKRK